MIIVDLAFRTIRPRRRRAQYTISTAASAWFHVQAASSRGITGLFRSALIEMNR
jgi:hypothetical protein